MNKIDEIVEREFAFADDNDHMQHSRPALRALLTEAAEPYRKDAERLMLFVGKIIERDDGGPYEWDGGDIQDLAEKCGMFIETPVVKPCGDENTHCHCADVGDFPTTCYRLSELGKKCAAIAAAEGK